LNKEIGEKQKAE